MTCGSWTLQVTPAITYPIRAYIQTYRPKVSSTAGKLISSQLQQAATRNNSISILTPGSQNPINLLIDDLNSANVVNNPAFAALLLQSNLDPMLGISSPFKMDNLNLSELASQCQTPLINSGILFVLVSYLWGQWSERNLILKRHIFN